MKRIVIVGAGASSLALVATLQLEAKTELDIVVLEQNTKVGRKLLATGNGRANLSHRAISLAHYHGGIDQKIENILLNFDAVAFFKRCGLETKYQQDLLYPRSEQATSVVACLSSFLDHVHVYLDTQVLDYTYQNGYYTIKTTLQDFKADWLVLATGSQAGELSGTQNTMYRLLKEKGYTMVPLSTSLVPLETQKTYPQLKGVRIKGTFTLYDGKRTMRQEKGELLFTEYGLSGIAIMQLSRAVSLSPKELAIEIDLFDDFSETELITLLHQRRTLSPDVFFKGLLPMKLAVLFEKQYAHLSNEALAHLLKHWRWSIKGTRSFKQAQVMAGVLSLKEVNADLESIKEKGLYVIGELLDIDGDCGGYNLHFAFACGYHVGKAILQKELL